MVTKLKRIKKERAYPDKALIKGALRRLMARSPMVKRVYEQNLHPTAKGIRGGKQYICNHCKKTFPSNRMAVDHIKPVVPINSNIQEMSYEMIVNRIFCPISNLQLLCETCHQIKSKEEREQRKQHRVSRI